VIVSAREQLDLEHRVAIASELHPDYWPAWLRDLVERLEAGQAWRDGQTTGLALAVVGRDPAQRDSYTGPGVRSRSRFDEAVQLVAPLREAISEATAARSA